MRAPVFVHSIGYRVGDACPISSIQSIARDRNLLESLTANGLRDYRISTKSPPELAFEAMRQTLERAALDPRQVGALVWASTSFQERGWHTDEVSRCLTELGLWGAVSVGVTLSECGNLVPALRVAAALVDDGCQHVMLVVTDKCESPEHRLVAGALSVLSDGAASCLVSRERRDFEVLAIRQVANHRARPSANADSVRLLRQNAEGMRRVAQEVFQAASVQPEDVACMIANNHSRTVLEVFAAQFRIAFDRLFTDNVSSYGHVFAADGLINLDSVNRQPADTFLIATNGACNWGAVIVRAVIADGGGL